MQHIQISKKFRMSTTVFQGWTRGWNRRIERKKKESRWRAYQRERWGETRREGSLRWFPA